MRKLTFIFIFFIFPVTSSMAAFDDDQELRSDIGSGLLALSVVSSIILGDEAGKDMKIKSDKLNLLMGTTMFSGIAYELLSSSSDRKEDKRASLLLFIDNNMDNLVRDMSRGEGEVLSTLTILWGMPVEGETIFNELVQDNLEKVFISENITPQELLTNLNKLILTDENIAKYSLS